MTQPAGITLSDIDIDVHEPWDITATRDVAILHLHTGHGTVLTISIPANVVDRMRAYLDAVNG